MQPSNGTVTVQIRPELLAEANAHGLDLQTVLEQALTTRLRDLREAAWRAENRAAIMEYNERISERGAFGDHHRRF